MTDPATLTAIITGLVSTFSAYLNYRAAVVKATEQGQPAPAQPADAKQGEAVAAAVETAITTHGTPDDQTDLASFQRNPQRYAGNLASVLTELAERNPAFAQQLQVLAQNANIVQPGGNVVNIDNKASNQGAQGTFNAPVSFGTSKRDDD